MIGFVVLHYLNFDVTKECIESLLAIEDINNAKIVIVDNASLNNSGKQLQELYDDVDGVKVIINSSNLGFAKGNNIGYEYLKNIGCDIIVVMNNDVFITQKDFISRLERIAEENRKVDVIAPDVLDIEGYHCNPIALPPISIEEMKRIYRSSKIRYLLYSVPIINRFLLKRHFSSGDSRVVKYNKPGFENPREDIIPHGCCVIFCNNWVKNEPFAFVPITFLYAEEHILYEYSKRKNYVIKYVPELTVNHCEAASTDIKSKVDRKAIKKRKQYFKWHMDAVKIYLKFIKG